MRDVETIIDDVLRKIEAETVRHGGEIGYIPDKDGFYTDMAKKDISWWTNGFWGGLLWQAYNTSGNEIYKSSAEESETKLDKAFDDFIGLHHDVGFMWLPTAGADYRVTGNKRSLARLLHAATILAGRYNPEGRFIRSWNDGRTGWVIIDSMMNISLLFTASRITGDPRYSQIARHHADTVNRVHIREDGSAEHIAVLDTFDGRAVEFLGGQGKYAGSAWTRGQAWALYGFTLCYLNTGNEKYLDTALSSARFINEMAECFSYVIPVDFRDRQDPRTDSVASTVMASAFASLHRITGDERHKETAEKLIDVLDKRFTDYNPSNDGIINGCTAAYHEKDNSSVKMQYADYFYLEALLKLDGRELAIWT